MDILKAIGLAKDYRTVMEYAKLKEYFRYKIGKNFKKGIIDDEEIDLYFGFGYRYENMAALQLHIENKKRLDDLTNIKVHIATYYILISIFIPLIMFAIMIKTDLSVNFATPFVVFAYLIQYVSFYVTFQNQFKELFLLLQKLEEKFLVDTHDCGSHDRENPETHHRASLR